MYLKGWTRDQAVIFVVYLLYLDFLFSFRKYDFVFTSASKCSRLRIVVHWHFLLVFVYLSHRPALDDNLLVFVLPGACLSFS